MDRQGRAEVQRALEASSNDLLRYFERRVQLPADAADLLGDTMLHAWRRATDCPTDPQRRRMWLFVIAAHVLANHRRGSHRRLPLANRLAPGTT